MFQLTRFGIKPGLEIIEHLVDGLDSPHKNYSIIHVAGTNGKGSVCAYLTSILQQSGFRVGTYTSPHLVKFNERICINNTPISDQEVVSLYEAVCLADTGKRKATFFEITTAMALYHFSQKKADWVILETGMGGRLDATNVVQPEVSIITNISVEHSQYLGNSIQDIAGEKAGIIKPNTPVVTAVSQDTAMENIQEAAKRNGVPLYQYQRDFSYKSSENNLENTKVMNYMGISQHFENIQIPMEGEHQKENLCLALAALELISQKYKAIDSRYDFSQEFINKALSHTKWPGRLEILCEKPLVILDGAHNLHAAYMLARYLEQTLKGRLLTLVMGILEDKPYEQMLGYLLPLASKLILTRPKINRSLDTKTLRQAARKYFTGSLQEIDDVASAATHAVETANENEVVCIAGSLYVAGEVKVANLFSSTSNPR